MSLVLYSFTIEHVACFFSNTIPVVVCPELMDPDNGQVELSDTVFGSAATYSCDDGYNLNGSVSRMCMADGQWSGLDPACQSK